MALPKALVSFIVAIAMVFIAGYLNPAFAGIIGDDGTLDQNTVCITSDHQNAGECKPGQKIIWAPKFFGNEQTPAVAAANLCNFNYPIVVMTGGVSCIFSGIPETVVGGQ